MHPAVGKVDADAVDVAHALARERRLELGKRRCDGREPADRREVELGLDDRVAGESVDDLRQRFAARRDQVEHERHRAQRIAHPADLGHDHAAVAFAAEEALGGLERAHDVRLADRGAVHDGAGELGRDVVDHARGREVRRERERPAQLEHALRREDERVLLADVAAVLVDDRQPVGVGILRETAGGAGGRADLRREFAEVLRGRLGRVAEDSRHLAVDVRHAAAERVEHHAAAFAAGGVDAVEDHMQLAGAYAVGHAGHDLEHAVDMALGRRRVGGDRADVERLGKRDVRRLEARDDRLRDRLRRCESVAVEALEAVPLDRIVARGHGHAAVGAERADHQPDRRRHRHADVDHIAADRRKRALYGARQCLAAKAAVARNDQLGSAALDQRANVRAKRPREGRGDHRGHRDSHDSTGAGDGEHEGSVVGGGGRHEGRECTAGNER